MRFTGIDIPEKLLLAQENETLVVFVGAGISIPSGFPNYNSLADSIGNDFGFSRLKDEPSDQFLGRIDENHKRAKQKAHNLFSDTTKNPCDLHKLIPNLFKKSVRIVTTNYDSLLTQSLNERGLEYETFYAPCLPLGSDFEGLVYLHGSIKKDSKHFVLTDADFGHAYITHGWASTFLKDMFETYDVLFIGYSHKDLVMQYFARGLYKQNSKERYIITDDSAANWGLYKLKPIVFLNDDKTYSKQKELLESWSKFTKSPLSDQKERLNQLLLNDPQNSILDVDDEDFIHHVLKDNNKIFWFLSDYSSSWIPWLNKNKYLDSIFSPFRVLSEPEDKIARAIADKLIGLKQQKLLFNLISEHRHQLNPAFASYILMSIHSNGIQDFSSEELISLLSILEKNELDNNNDYWCYLLNQLTLPKDLNLCIYIFSKLIDCWCGVDNFFKSFEGEDNLRFEVKYKDSAYWLNDFWDKTYDLILSKNCSLAFYNLFKCKLLKAHNLLHPNGINSDEYDRLSHKRPAIERNSQNHDYTNDVFNFILNALDDLVSWICENDQSFAEAELLNLSKSSFALVRRISFNFISKCDFMSPSDKLNWAIKSGDLYHYNFHHESYYLLGKIYPLLNTLDRVKIVEYAMNAELPSESEEKKEEFTRYLRKSRLGWLKQTDEDCPTLLDIEAKYFPEGLSSHDHADFTSWTGPVEYKSQESPYSAEQMLSTDTSSLVDELVKIKEYPVGEFSQHGVTLELEKACISKPSLSFEIAQQLISKQSWTTFLWESLFTCFEKSLLEENDWANFMSIIKSHAQLHLHNYGLSRLFLKTSENNHIPEGMKDDIIAFLISFYKVSKSHEEKISEPDEWLHRAINHFSGNIIFAILRILSGRKSTTLPDNIKQFLEEILKSRHVVDRIAKCAIASQAHYINYLSPSFSKEDLIPFFDTATSDWRPFWQGYLQWGRPTRDLVIQMAPHIKKFFETSDIDDLEERALEYLAHILLSGVINPFDNDLIISVLKSRSTKGAEIFANFLSRQIDGMKSEDKELVWREWLQKYLIIRLSRAHADLSAKEYGSILSLILSLDKVLTNAAQIIMSSPPEPLSDGWIYHHINSNQIYNSHSESVIDILSHILPKQERNWYQADIENTLNEIFNKSLPYKNESMKVVCNELIRLGSEKAKIFLQKLD